MHKFVGRTRSGIGSTEGHIYIIRMLKWSDGCFQCFDI